MSPDALSTIEVVDRFVIAGRYREYMALVRLPGGRILFSSGWNQSRKVVEERAKKAQRELGRQERRQLDQLDVGRMTDMEALDCRLEIEERSTDFGSAFRARIRRSENGDILYETGWCAEAMDAENLARAYMQRIVYLSTPDVEV